MVLVLALACCIRRCGKRGKSGTPRVAGQHLESVLLTLANTPRALLCTGHVRLTEGGHVLLDKNLSLPRAMKKQDHVIDFDKVRGWRSGDSL